MLGGIKMERDKKVYKLNGVIVNITKDKGLENFFINNFNAYDLALKLLEDGNDINNVINILGKMRYMLYINSNEVRDFFKLFGYDLNEILKEKSEEVYNGFEITPSMLSYLNELKDIKLEDGMILVEEDNIDNVILELIQDLFGK